MSGPASLERRQLWRRSAATLARAAVLAGPSAPSSTDYIHVRDYDAAGNGTADDTAAINNALAAAQPGTTVICQPGATYLVLGTIVMATNNVTLDLNGSTIVDGSVGTGGATVVLQLKGTNPWIRLTDVRVTNGTIMAPTAGGGLSFLYLIQAYYADRCRLDHLSFQAVNMQTALFLENCNQTTVEDCYFNGAGINGYSCQECVVQRNVFENPFEGVGFTGYDPGTVGTAYNGNLGVGWSSVNDSANGSVNSNVAEAPSGTLPGSADVFGAPFIPANAGHDVWFRVRCASASGSLPEMQLGLWDVTTNSWTASTTFSASQVGTSYQWVRAVTGVTPTKGDTLQFKAVTAGILGTSWFVDEAVLFNLDAGGLAGGPLINNRFLYNVVRNYSRVGIELYSTNGLDVSGQVILGNHIEKFNAPQGGTAGQATLGSGQAISSISTGSLIAENVIEDAGPNWAIEADAEATRLLGNRVVWSATGTPGTGIIVNSSAVTEVMAAVEANQVVAGLTGIQITGSSPYFPAGIAVVGNIIQDCHTGVDGGNSGEGASVRGNLVRYTLSAGAARVGIECGPNNIAMANRIDFLPQSAGQQDTGLGMFSGASGTLVGNVVDGGGAGVVSQASFGNAVDWTIGFNRFQNGASLAAGQSNLGVITLVENVGSVAAATPTASPTASASSASATGSDFGGAIAFTASSTPAAGPQVTVAFGRARRQVPVLELTPGDPVLAGLGLYVSAVSATGFTVATQKAPPAGAAMSVTYVMTEALQ